MATDPYWQLEKEYTTIAATHDLTIKAIAYDNISRTENDKTIVELAPCKVHEFRVKRDILTAASPVLRKLLTAAFRETEQTAVELHYDPAKALQVWFQILHVEDGTTADVKFEGLAELGLQEVWEVLSTAHKYELDPRDARAKAWFEKWYASQANKDGRRFGYLDFQALIFPCHAFDYATGFTYATKQLVYRSNGHITERQPPGFKQQDHLHLSGNIIQQLNAAKGRLKTVLHRELYNPIEALLKRHSCACKPHVLYAYEQALANTGVWPLETSFSRNSVNDILQTLETDFRPAYHFQTCGMPFCSFDFVETVRKACEKTRGYFDGLCLDCMYLSHPKLADHDEDYWNHAKLTVAWDQGCRLRHKQPSWYFSFMGRRQKMVQWTKTRGRGSGGQGYD